MVEPEKSIVLVFATVAQKSLLVKFNARQSNPPLSTYISAVDVKSSVKVIGSIPVILTSFVQAEPADVNMLPVSEEFK